MADEFQLPTTKGVVAFWPVGTGDYAARARQLEGRIRAIGV
jgi:hypothetical protein